MTTVAFFSAAAKQQRPQYLLDLVRRKIGQGAATWQEALAEIDALATESLVTDVPVDTEPGQARGLGVCMHVLGRGREQVYASKDKATWRTWMTQCLPSEAIVSSIRLLRGCRLQALFFSRVKHTHHTCIRERKERLKEKGSPLT